jgi:hypothetical protein
VVDIGSNPDYLPCVSIPWSHSPTCRVATLFEEFHPALILLLWRSEALAVDAVLDVHQTLRVRGGRSGGVLVPDKYAMINVHVPSS